ncbi:MAG TPA: dTDP-4-dehydrorhamnose reductase [Terracidiphilus sp.]|jgi:dTDP-4-dehydrorhamnose reductase|nr:dTDP-4-dehydrorhamnose reductase [Terracidiphilus sp.]
MSSCPRILILGSTGQLGQELQRSFLHAGSVVAVGRAKADFANPEQIAALVRENAPDIILNAAAYTAVDRAESEPELAMTVNARTPERLAEEASRLGALLVHYSTDYVFDGSKAGPWEETDTTKPVNVYGATKRAGEQAMTKVGGKFLIFRTSWVYGPHGKNFLLTMLRLGRERDHLEIVDDQIGAPTTSIELADATHAIVDGVLAGKFGATAEWSGIYHMTCGGAVSWCGFAKAIFERSGSLLGGKSPAVSPIPTSAYPTPARRPQNSVLSNEKLFTRFGLRLAPWPDALDAALGELRKT